MKHACKGLTFTGEKLLLVYAPVDNLDQEIYVAGTIKDKVKVGKLYSVTRGENKTICIEKQSKESLDNQDLIYTWSLTTILAIDQYRAWKNPVRITSSFAVALQNFKQQVYSKTNYSTQQELKRAIAFMLDSEN